jgi:hypothetical protein
VHVNPGVLARNDASGVLPAMLEEQEPVIEELVDGRPGDDSDDAAHGSETLPLC